MFLLTLVTGWTADRRRPPLDRPRVGGARARLRDRARLVRVDPTTTLAVLYAIAALLGVARAFAGPALGALAPNLVPREILPAPSRFSSISWQIGAIVGPALGGYLYAYAPYAPYAVSAVLFVIAFVGLFAIGPRPSRDRGAAHPWAQMVDGLQLRSPQPARARRNQPRPIRSAARRRDGDAAGVRRDVLHAGPEGSAISAPRRRSARR